MDTPGREGRPLPTRAFSPAATPRGAETQAVEAERVRAESRDSTHERVRVAHVHALHGRLLPGTVNDPRLRVSVPANT